MATDFSIRIDADISEFTADKIDELSSKLLAALQPYTTVTAHNSYSVGTTVDDFVLDIGAGGTVTEDWGFRVLIDSTVSKNRKVEILAKFLNIAGIYTVDTIDPGEFAVGNGTFQYEVTLT